MLKLIVFLVIVSLCLLHLYVIAAIVFVLILLSAFLNKKVLIGIRKPLERLDSKREIMNVDTLVIGDLCSMKTINSYSNDESRVVIMAPGRSLYSSLVILNHTGSVLKKGGRVVIIAPKKKVKQKLTVFDTPFVSFVTSLEEGCNKNALENNYPFFVAPVRCIKMLLGNKASKTETQCKDNKIIDYCQRKGFKLVYLV